MTCQVSTNACLPGRVAEHKQKLRGAELWYVVFDSASHTSLNRHRAGSAFAVCPWTPPNVRPKLLAAIAPGTGSALSEWFSIHIDHLERK